MLRAEWPLEGIHNKFRLEVGKRVGIAGGKMIEVVDLNTSLNPSCKLKQRTMAIDFKEDVLLTLYQRTLEYYSTSYAPFGF